MWSRYSRALPYRGSTEVLKSLEVGGFRIVFGDQVGPGHEGVVVGLLEAVEDLFDSVGELLRCQNSVRGVNLEAVVLGWVVAAGERDARRRRTLEDHRRDDRGGHVAGRQFDRDAVRRDELGGRLCELLGQQPGVETDHDVRGLRAVLSEGLNHRLYDHPHSAEGQLAADDAAPPGSPEMHHRGRLSCRSKLGIRN